jgi:hypothetical protein
MAWPNEPPQAMPQKLNLTGVFTMAEENSQKQIKAME